MSQSRDPIDSMQRKIDSRAEFDAGLHELVDLALQRSAHSMLWVDRDFAEWPLDAPELLAQLSDWLRQPQRRLVLLATDFGEVQRRRARFVAWYRLWSHTVTAFGPADEVDANLPTVAWAESAAMLHLSDREHWRGWISSDGPTLRQWHDQIDAVLQRSAPAFPVTTLGL